MLGSQVGTCTVGPRTFLTVQEFIWYNCSAVYRLSAWRLYGGIDGDLFQEPLCHTQVCSTQSPCPFGRPLLTHTSAGNTQTLKGRSGSVFVGYLGPGAHKVLFEPSEHLWHVWGLILITISPFLLSCWGFSFALGRGVSFFGEIQHSLVRGKL